MWLAHAAAALATLSALGCSLGLGSDPPSLSKLVVQQSSTTIVSYDFGGGVINVAGSPVAFSLLNQGSATVDLGGSAVLISGANASEFALATQPASSLPAGQRTTFCLTFDPVASTGRRTATVTITPVSGGQSTSFTVIGTGVDFGVQQPGGCVSTYDFGVQTVGVATSAVTFTIYNETSSSMSLGPSSVSIAGANASDFHKTDPQPPSAAAGGSANFTLSFKPGSYGPRTATVNVVANGSSPTFSFTVNGTGTSGEFSLTSYDGSTVSNGETITHPPVTTTYASFSFTVSNLSGGTDSLTLAGSSPYVTVSNPAFTVTPQLGGNPIAPGGTWQYSIGIGGVPQDTSYSTTVTIHTSDADNATFTYYLTVYYQGHL